MLIRRVEDSDGKVLYQDAGKSHRAVSEATAFLMSSMLADVINAGTAYRARQTGFSLPAAGKTGTTNDYVDAWFVGFTPHLVTGVWVGFDQPTTIVANGYAGELAVPIWAQLHEGGDQGGQARLVRSPGRTSSASTSAACRASCPTAAATTSRSSTRDGWLETRSMVYTEYFVKGTQPTESVPAPPVVVVHGSARRACSARASRASPCRAEDAGLPPAQTGDGRRASGAGPGIRGPAEPAPAMPTAETARRSAASGRAYSAGTTRRRSNKDRIRRKKKDSEAGLGLEATRLQGTVGVACRTSRPNCHAISVTSSGHRRMLSRSFVARAASRGTLPPSLIFAGPDGVGKRMAAVALAQLLNCLVARCTVDGRRTPAATCASCKRIARGVHADVLARRAGRHRRDQGRSGPRRDRAHRLPAVRGPPPRRHHGRGGRAQCRGAERAAQDARGAAGGLDVRARDLAARRAAADGAVALPAAALRPARRPAEVAGVLIRDA